MRSTYILLLSAFISSGIYAQDDRQAIQQWQSLHPGTLLVSAERFNQLSDEEQQLLGENYLVFDNTISLKQLTAYDAADKSTSSAANKPGIKGPSSLYMKQWIALNPDVTIIAKSDFNTMDEAKKQECLSNPLILLLKGETLTAQDVYDYEN